MADNPFVRVAAVGGGQSPPMADRGNIALDTARVEASAQLQKRGRGRPRKDGQPPHQNVSPEKAGIEADQKKLAELFDPAIWGPIVSMPADAMLALTGHEHWNLRDTERSILGTTASTAAQYLGVQSPKTLALALVLINLAMVYLPRTIKEFSLIRDERESKKQRNDAR